MGLGTQSGVQEQEARAIDWNRLDTWEPNEGTVWLA